MAGERWYDFPEFGGYLGNVRLNVIWGMSVEDSFAVWRAIAQLFGESEKTSLCVPVGRNGTDLLQALDVQFDGLPAVSPELSCRLIMLKNFGYRAMLLPYEPCTFFRDQFPDGGLPLPTFGNYPVDVPEIVT